MSTEGCFKMKHGGRVMYRKRRFVYTDSSECSRTAFFEHGRSGREPCVPVGRRRMSAALLGWEVPAAGYPLLVSRPRTGDGKLVGRRQRRQGGRFLCGGDGLGFGVGGRRSRGHGAVREGPIIRWKLVRRKHTDGAGSEWTTCKFSCSFPGCEVIKLRKPLIINRLHSSTDRTGVS